MNARTTIALVLIGIALGVIGCTSQHNIRIEVDKAYGGGLPLLSESADGEATKPGEDYREATAKGKAPGAAVTIIINQNSNDTQERPKVFETAASVAAGQTAESGDAALTKAPAPSPLAPAPAKDEMDDTDGTDE